MSARTQAGASTKTTKTPLLASHLTSRLLASETKKTPTASLVLPFH
ncbi:hypothetical protein L917_02637 [Phytophthora nicotianae]|uniref:Uncharacterized protein n=1 Tax=Phytophthora nicotianae TaxID=4792 RepID=W2LVG5_PHYNI|nr:hypothetical protein L917_02637 [Phytophthora nicotianae]